jgi:DNA mismatch endonuclease, patch repair protein
MADIVSSDVRSRMMSGIRGKNTRPELAIRKGLFALGFRYRIHGKRLPGKPDLVLSKYRAAIFVNGCFWHGHDCPLFKWPSSNVDFWRNKILRNRELDRISSQALKHLGWRVLKVWECALKGPSRRPPGEVVSLAAKWIDSDLQTKELRGGKASGRTRDM